VTINSDDPAYFGGYLNENYLAVHRELGMSAQEPAQLARNSFEASFLAPSQKQHWLQAIDDYMQSTAAN
jgi:adenosine deaminase